MSAQSTALPAQLRPARPGSGPHDVLVRALHQGSQLVVQVAGEADVSTAEQLQADLLAVLSGEPSSVTVDLTGLAFCGLAGLDALHALLSAATAQGLQVRLLGI